MPTLAEWLLVVLALGAVSPLFLGRWATPRIRLCTGLFLGLALLSVWGWQMQLGRKLASASQLSAPQVGRPDEYAGSASCQACHPDPYASWHRSFHRTMTQIASPESIRGKFDGVTLETEGDTYKLSRRGDEFWVEMPDPDSRIQQSRFATAVGTPNPSPPAPRVNRRISMVTGSHHMQAYWVDNQHGNQQFSFPFTYLLAEERWVPRNSVFILDPQTVGRKQVWNVGCIDCHSTAGQPKQRAEPKDFDTRVAELGIACEACHGPGAEHVRLNSDPRRRYSLHLKGQGDASIVNPARLSSKRSADVCGRCHSVHTGASEADWLANGTDFKPGEELATKTHLTTHIKSVEARRTLFWSDDMVRVSGREYTGLLKTACFKKGEMSCLSCHSLHRSEPANQVAAGMDSNAACFQCHPSLQKNLAQHTHHAAGSSGSLCYNCHMPRTTYGLMKAIRSHQVSSPGVAASLQTGRPNACNLCHLDKTLDWTAQSLNAWYQTPKPELDDENKTVAASILWTLKGDAGQRALLAWHMGWAPAKEISNSSWIAPYLAALLEDPYPSVRHIAGASLQTLPGYEHFAFDYVAGDAALRQSAEDALATWLRSSHTAANPTLLLGPNGSLDRKSFEALLKLRNNRVVELNE